MAKKIEQQLRDELSDNLALLAQLSDDVSVRKPTRVKATKLPKYVGGVTESQGNSMYKAELASSATALGRTFKQQNAMSASLDLAREIRATVGSSKQLQLWVDASVQVAIHLVVECAQRSSALLSAGKNIARGLNAYKDEVVKGSIVKGLEAWNNTSGGGVEYDGKIFNYLYPINLAWLKSLDAQVIDIISQKDDMEKYVANAEAQRAVVNYMASHSVPADVLLPLEISNASGSSPVDKVENALLRDPGKNIEASYNFYKKAVDASYDMDRSLRTGEVESNIKSAVRLLKELGRSMGEAGISSSVASQFNREFTRIAKELSRLNLDKASAQDGITLALLDLCDLTRTSPSVLKHASSAVGGLQSSTNFVSLLGDAPSASVLDAQDLMKVSSLNSLIISNPIVAQLKNRLIQIFLSLDEAYNGLAPMSLFAPATGSAPTSIASKRLVINEDFKDAVNNAIIDVVNTASTQINSTLTGNAIQLAKVGFANALGNMLQANVTDAQIAQFLGQADQAGALASLQSGRTGTRGGGPSASPSAIAISGQMFREIANSNVPKLSTRLVSGRSVEQEALDAITRANNAFPRKVRGTDLRKAKSVVLNLTKYASNYLNSMSAQARSAGIKIDTRANPLMSTGAQVGVGVGTLVGDHAVSALMNRFIQPECGSVMAHVSDALPSLATAGYGAMKIRQGDSSLGIPLVSGAVAHLALRYAFKHPALRFSENPVLKALQYPTNYVASLAGDLSMGASSVSPADAQAHSEDIAEYVEGLVKTNCEESLVHITAQLWESGLQCQGQADGSIKIAVGEAKSGNPWEVATCLGTDKLEMMGLEGEELTKALDTFRNGVKSAIGGHSAFEAPTMIVPVEEAPAVQSVDGFILEPGYNMDVYSGEDQVNYLTPAPIVTSQSGFAQLEEAINRATLLSPTDKLAEGIDDLQDVAVIRVDPQVARDAESVGMGVSLGQSRQNPATELLAIEVEGANGLMPVAPMRQQSVPQGSLNYAKIGHSPVTDVSPRGLFNRGVFTPSFGRQ